MPATTRKYVLAVDLGTSGPKVALVSTDGAVLGHHQTIGRSRLGSDERRLLAKGAVGLDVVAHHGSAGRVRVIERSAVRTETETVCQPDVFGDDPCRPVEIDQVQIAGWADSI